jgi:WD40 repeat protein
MTRKTQGTASAEKAAYQFDGIVVGLSFLEDGTLAVALGNGSVRLIGSPSSGKALAVHPHAANAAILAATTDCDGGAILTGGDDGRLMRVAGDGGTRLLAEFAAQQVDSIAAHAGTGLRAAAAGREVRLIDRKGDLIGSTSDHPTTVTGLAFHPKGERLAVSHYNGVSLWPTLRFGSEPVRLASKGSHIAVTWSPDGSTVITSMQGNELHGWPLSGGRDMIMRGYPSKVRALDWLEKPMMLLSSGADAVIAWTFTGSGPTGTVPLEIGSGLGQLVTAIALQRGRKAVAVGFDCGRVALCGIGTHAVHLLKETDGDRVSALTWSADGGWLAAGGEAGRVSVFELTSPCS